MLSDGAQTESGDPVEAARQAGVPIYTVGLGKQDSGGGSWRNLGVSEVNVPTRVAINQEVEMKVTVTQGRDSPGPRRRWELRLGKDLVASQPLRLTKQGRQQVSLKFTPDRKGTWIYTVSVPHLEGDGLKEDDSQDVTILAADSKLKVLYVEGSLRWIYKFLRRVLEREQTIQADCVILTGGGKMMQQGEGGLKLRGGLPTDLAGMQKYDAIVLGGFSARAAGGCRAQVARSIRQGEEGRADGDRRAADPRRGGLRRQPAGGDAAGAA